MGTRPTQDLAGQRKKLHQDPSALSEAMTNYRALFGATINPLDLVISRQANDLRLTIHGSPDQITIINWHTSPTTNQVETIQAGNGQTLLTRKSIS